MKRCMFRHWFMGLGALAGKLKSEGRPPGWRPQTGAEAAVTGRISSLEKLQSALPLIGWGPLHY